jgi:hypothetical protein
VSSDNRIHFFDRHETGRVDGEANGPHRPSGAGHGVPHNRLATQISSARSTARATRRAAGELPENRTSVVRQRSRGVRYHQVLGLVGVPQMTLIGGGVADRVRE